jgi:ribosomal protein L11 methyltransferase
LLILPAWLESPDPARIAIRIDPGMALGTGTHPTTQLCLELIEDWFNLPSAVTRPPSLIDIGCGSGILSIAALKLGAQRALAVDIDPESVANARHNAAANRVGEELTLGQGSVAEVLAGGYSYKSAPLVVANILAPVLIRLLTAGLGDLVEAGGVLILSGILEDQADPVVQAAQARGLNVSGRRQMGDWVALAFER